MVEHAILAFWQWRNAALKSYLSWYHFFASRDSNPATQKVWPLSRRLGPLGHFSPNNRSSSPSPLHGCLFDQMSRHPFVAKSPLNPDQTKSFNSPFHRLFPATKMLLIRDWLHCCQPMWSFFSLSVAEARKINRLKAGEETNTNIRSLVRKSVWEKKGLTWKKIFLSPSLRNGDQASNQVTTNTGTRTHTHTHSHALPHRHARTHSCTFF